MRPIRRNDMTSRVEIMPLIDVIFLLLTFFIYSLIVMVRAEVLPVTLTTITTGRRATPAKVHAITIDREGHLFLDREPIDPIELSHFLTQVTQQPQRPTVYLALEAEGFTDRGPTLIGVIEQIRAAGIEDFVIVGQPAPGGSNGAVVPETVP